jgi:subtilisin family serine protease/subtilisin-like proprotein convertase family protein
MKQKRFILLLFVTLLALAGAAFYSSHVTAGSIPAAQPWQEKVDGWVMSTASDSQPTEFLVVLSEQADLSMAANLTTKEEKGRYVYETLSQLAARTQGPVIEELEKLDAEYRAYWVSNMIWVRGDMDIIQAMARRSDVARIDGNRPVRMDEPIQETVTVYTPTTTEWGVDMIQAPAVWNLGYDGTGIVVGGQDTGYRYTHDAIDDQYRGSGGSHDYNWHDAIHSGGGSCGADSPFPCDDDGHGTHTMGTMVGDDGQGNQVGVAPGAQWIGCRNMNVGVGTPTTYSECFQWFIAPTRIDGSDPNPAMAPHVINNSWGCPASEGCAWDTLQTVVGNTRAAGIVVVVSAGNAGSSCNTVNDPPAIYDDAYSIGSTTSTDTISSFSSRGPADGTGLPKPDISAPGSSVRSASGSSDTGYVTLSGTSMAGPHVAGAVALLLQRAPSLIGDQTAVENLLNATAAPKTSTQTCGGVPGSAIPNNTYGWGRLDILAAVNQAAPDFTINVTPASQAVCIANNAVYSVTIGSLGGITSTVTLSASGYPVGATSHFTPTAAVPAFTSTLTISDTAGVTAGSYQIDVVGTAASLVHTGTVTLMMNAAFPISPTLTTPANNATGVATFPTYSWTAVADAASYDIQIATDAAFTNIVDSAAGLTTTSYDAAVPLNATTQYYWRVRANNGCGIGEYAAVFTFTTANIVCATYPATDVPLPIPAAGTSGSMTSVINIPDDGVIDDVNVVNLAGTHTYMGDLDFQLAGPSATTIQLRAEACSSADNFDINYDDEAAPGAPPCPPIDGGTYRPDGPGALSDFDGEDLSGAWTLTINDNATGDSGALNSWGVEICYAPAAAPVIGVAPAALTSIQAPDTQVTQTVTISNSGNTDLTWNLYEAAADCATPQNIAWLAAAPVSGTVTAGNAAASGVIFDTAGMVNGTYNANLCITSNDAAAPTTTLPITLTIPTLPPVPTAPADGDIDASTMPTLTWTAVAGANDYLVEVATDNGFANIVVSATVTATTHSGFTLDEGMTYYWRVTAQTSGGGSAVSTTFSFTTAVVERVYLPIITRP